MSAGEDTVVTISHLYSVPNMNGGVGFCARGARDWAKRHGIDWLSFVRNGIPASELLKVGDAFAVRLVEHARSVSRGQ